MAGSWQHMTTDTGELRSNESFCDLLENGGDCYEASEQCFGMVQWLAERLANHAGESREYWIGRAEKHYKHGLEIGGVEEE
jgi:hypothetical protein